MNIEHLEKWHFEITEQACNALLNLVLQGQKKATSSSKLAFSIKGEQIPKVGELSVITDWADCPKCIVKTTNVVLLPFKDITYDLAKLEGEDDSLDSWKESHIHFFMEEGKELGYEFTEDMEVVFEQFEIVEIL